MLGIVDGAAPPFIMLSFVWAMVAGLAAFASFASREPGLWWGAKDILYLYAGSTPPLALLLFFRIVLKASLGPGEGEAALWGLDVVIIGLTFLAASSAWTVTVVILRYLREKYTAPGRARD